MIVLTMPVLAIVSLLFSLKYIISQIIRIVVRIEEWLELGTQ